MGEMSLALYRFLFNWIFFILAGNHKDNHKSWDEFKFWRDSTTDYGVTALERLKNLCLILLALLHLHFDSIFYISAGKEDNHESSDEIEFQPDLTTDCRVNYH